MTSATNSLLLHDIHLPKNIDWWPPAPGWWMVGAAMLVLLAVAVIVYRYRQRRIVQRVAQQELRKIKQAYTQGRDAHELIRQLSIYLRRVCLTNYPRYEVAGLTGRDWLAFLDQGLASSKTTTRFSDTTGQALLSGPYQRAANIDAEALLALCEHWTAALARQKRSRR